ncbi:MAG TPA: sigma-70 family RNA polymerase sigma factor [Paludibacter sp.]
MKFKNKTVDSLAAPRFRDEFLAGNESAYSSIYELYARDLYAFGLSLRAKQELIEDAIHDIFVEIYTHRKNLEKVDNLKFYFLVAFRNRLFFLLKKESHTFEITEKDMLGLEEKNFLELWIENEDDTEKQLLVKRLLSELNKNQQEALYHRFVEGLSCDEIALLMNINYQSAKNLIHRSIKKLKSVAVFGITLFILICFYR